MRILGLSNMRDAAAALVENGRIIAAAEEERFVRIKHVPTLPIHAVRYCLDTAGIRLEDLDAVAVPWKYWQLGRRAALAIGSMLQSPRLFAVKGARGAERLSNEWRELAFLRLLLSRRAKLRREHLRDLAGAAADLRKLHDLSPSDQTVLDELYLLLRDLGDYRGMVQLYEDQILRGKDMNARAELARKVARVWEEQLADVREAADAWRRVLRMKAGDPEATQGLERTKTGQWESMRDLVNDAMLDALVPTAPFGAIAELLRERYRGVADALTLRLPKDPSHDTAFARVIQTLRES